MRGTAGAGLRRKPETGGATRFSKPDDPRAAALAPSLVGVTFDMPYSVSGITERNYRGTGLVVDAAARPGGGRSQYRAGVDGRRAHHLRAARWRFPARWSSCIPLHNLAIVSYDPKLIGNTPVQERASC